MGKTPPRPPMPIPGSMQLPPGQVRFVGFQWMGEGWSLFDLIEPLPGHNAWGARFMRGQARRIIREGGHAFVWACWADQTKEIPL